MAKLPHPQAPAIFRALFPGLVDWLESPWAGRPQFTAAHSFRVEEMARDNRYVIRAELPGPGTGEGHRSHHRGQDPDHPRGASPGGQRTLSLRVPLRLAHPAGQAARQGDTQDVTARYDRGVLEVSVPVDEVKPEGIRVPIENADSAQAGTLGRQEPAGRTHTLDPGRRAAVILGGAVGAVRVA